MNILGIIGLIIGAITIIITVQQYLFSRAFKKGEINQVIKDMHEQLIEYGSKREGCVVQFAELRTGKADNKSIEEIRMDLGIIKTVILGEIPVMRKLSPLNINDFGKKIADETDIYSKIDANLDNSIKLIESKLTTENPYDIQQVCFDLGYACSLESSAEDAIVLKPEDLASLKTHAFKNGYPMLYYGAIIGIILRNKYFEYKRIDISEIDKHDPAKPSEADVR